MLCYLGPCGPVSHHLMLMTIRRVLEASRPGQKNARWFEVPPTGFGRVVGHPYRGPVARRHSPSRALSGRSTQERAENVGKRCATYPANLCLFLLGVEFSEVGEDLGDAVGHAVEDATVTAIGKCASEHFQHMLSGLE